MLNTIRNKERGFTIVELLIVIVVIAILVAISIVAYTSITSRANTSSAMAAAEAVKDVAETYRGANSTYPTLKSQFLSGGTEEIAKLPADITFVGTAPSNPTSPKTVMVVPHGSPVEGFVITYWNYQTGATGTVNVGDVSGTAGTALPDNT